MIDTAQRAAVVRRSFVSSMSKVVALVNSRRPTDAQTTATQIDDTGGAQVVNTGCHPSSVIQFVEGLTGFVIASHENGQIGCHQFAAVVLVERAHGSIFGWHGNGVQIGQVAEGFKIAATNEQVDFVAVVAFMVAAVVLVIFIGSCCGCCLCCCCFLFVPLQSSVNGFQFAVTTSFNGDANR